jgi:hypothetical protein
LTDRWRALGLKSSASGVRPQATAHQPEDLQHHHRPAGADGGRYLAFGAQLPPAEQPGAGTCRLYLPLQQQVASVEILIRQQIVHMERVLAGMEVARPDPEFLAKE